MIIDPKTALINEDDDSLPYSLAISTASSIATFGGILVWENNISQIAKRKIDKSTRLILSMGHFGAKILILLSISSILTIMSFIDVLGVFLIDSQAKSS